MTALPGPPFKKVKQEREESEIGLNDLPELPFELILGNLMLEDRLKARSVSRRWCKTIDSFRPKSLCFSEQPSGFILGKSRWLSGEFAWNFVSSSRFESFFNVFGHSILLNLKHLRLCDARPQAENRRSFAQTLESFGKLEQLDIIRSGCIGQRFVTLNLPMLKSLQLDELCEIDTLVLEAPKLQRIRFANCTFLELDIVHGESVQALLTNRMTFDQVKRLKNLKCLYIDSCKVDWENDSEIDSTFLSALERLEEIHLFDHENALKLFEQKQQYGRTQLKIFLFGFHLHGPDDPMLSKLVNNNNEKYFSCLAEQPARLANELPFRSFFAFETFEDLDSESQVNILRRFTDLQTISVSSLVDIERFLDFFSSNSKNFSNIVELQFWGNHQPAELFDRLPDNCAIQKLIVYHTELTELEFLFRLEHLIYLELSCLVDAVFIQKTIEKLEFLTHFLFKYINKFVTINIERPNEFQVLIDLKEKFVPDVEAVIQHLVESTRKA